MCRLFGFLGSPASRPEPWLVSTNASLLAQARVTPETAQRDGWGIAWFDEQRALHLQKGAGGAFEEAERPRFLEAARNARGPVVLAHLRHASNPMHLPPERLIGMENSQPFTDGTRAFIHNGSIHFPRETRARLGKYETRIRGVNDSEVLFYLLSRHLDASGDPAVAYARAREELEQVWRDQGAPASGAYSGLNVIFTRGPNEIWAFCDWLGDHGGSLCSPDRPYYEMVYVADARQVLIASEPLDLARADWKTLARGHYLHGRASEGLIALDTEAIPQLQAPPPA